MVWVGALLVVLTFVAIIRGYEMRLVLFLSGVLMAALSGKPGAAFDAFGRAMVNDGLVPVVCTIIGFAFVMRYTNCDDQFLRLVKRFPFRYNAILIPGTVLATFAVNILVPSAAGCAAAVGIIAIPLLMRVGVKPIIAASSVLAGTWGSCLTVDDTHNAFIAKLAGISPAAVIDGHVMAALAGVATAAAALSVVALRRKEDRGYNPEPATADPGEPGETLPVDYRKAFVPLIPLLLLLLSGLGKYCAGWPALSVPEAMLIGTALGYGVSLGRPDGVTGQFFAGMGDAYAKIIGVIIAVAVFNEGMWLSGLTNAILDVIKHSDSVARFTATLGPLLIAVVSGSGDAATLAFNGVITPHAQQFGRQVAEMGSQAYLAGAIGRAMSPVAGATIVCATLAGVSPVAVVKRNAPGMIAAAAVTMLLLF